MTYSFLIRPILKAKALQMDNIIDHKLINK